MLFNGPCCSVCPENVYMREVEGELLYMFTDPQSDEYKNITEECCEIIDGRLIFDGDGYDKCNSCPEPTLERNPTGAVVFNPSSDGNATVNRICCESSGYDYYTGRFGGFNFDDGTADSRFSNKFPEIQEGDPIYGCWRCPKLVPQEKTFRITVGHVDEFESSNGSYTRIVTDIQTEALNGIEYKTIYYRFTTATGVYASRLNQTFISRTQVDTITEYFVYNADGSPITDTYCCKIGALVYFNSSEYKIVENSRTGLVGCSVLGYTKSLYE